MTRFPARCGNGKKKKKIHINFKKDVPLRRSLQTNLFSSVKGTKFLKQQIVKKYGMGKRLKKKGKNILTSPELFSGLYSLI